MLTKGPFAIFFGGKDLLAQLETKTPFPTVLLLILLSTLFQMVLYTLKKMKTRQQMKHYLHNFKQNMVENVRNVFGVFIITLITVICFFFISFHFAVIKANNKEFKKDPSEVPQTIFILCGVNLFISLLPFKSYPLR